MSNAETITITDRIRKPWLKKINPIWWAQNDSEQTVDQASWYHPEWAEWRRQLVWNVFRNPLQNFRAFVVGVQDKNYKVVGRAPVRTVQRNDLQPPETGWQWCVLFGGELWIPRAFVCYSSVNHTFYIGWQWSGFFGAKIN